MRNERGRQQLSDSNYRRIDHRDTWKPRDSNLEISPGKKKKKKKKKIKQEIEKYHSQVMLVFNGAAAAAPQHQTRVTWSTSRFP